MGAPPAAAFPFDGITDAAGNSLDGNADGAASGPGDDDYDWNFQTTNNIDLTAPKITAVSPAPFATQVQLSAPLSATFSKPLLSKSITRQSVQVDGLQNYHLNYSTDGNTATVRISHPDFSQDLSYSPVVTSGVRDIYQNCFNPCSGP